LPLFRAVVVRKVGERLRCGGNDEVARSFKLYVRRDPEAQYLATEAADFGAFENGEAVGLERAELRRGDAGGDDLVRRAVGERRGAHGRTLLAHARADAWAIVIVVVEAETAVVIVVAAIVIVVGEGGFGAELVKPDVAGCRKGVAGERQRHPDGQEQARLQQ